MDIQDVVLADVAGAPRFNINAASLAGLFKDCYVNNELVPAVVAADEKKRFAAVSG